MGFLGATTSSKLRTRGNKELSADLIERLGQGSCALCPRNHDSSLQHPKMEAHGTTKPWAYILGEAPGAEEDARGRPFVGKAGRTLRLRIPDGWKDRIRWNNVIQCRPPENREPLPVEVACCRRRIVRDIEKTRPRAILGMGNVPLQWMIDQTGITKWSGRRIPVQIGSHRCWFYPMLHPSYVMRSRKFTPSDPSDYGSEIEFTFALDMRRALEEIEAGLPDPIIHTSEQARENVQCITGERSTDLNEVLRFIGRMRNEKLVGLDYETNCVRPYEEGAKILTIAISGREETLAFALDHKGAAWTAAQRDQIWEAYSRFLLRAPQVRKVVHQLGFELEWTGYFFGRRTLRAGAWGCSVVQAYTLDERMKMGAPDALSLEFLCLQYFGINVKELSDLDRAKLDDTPVGEVLQYNGIDARYHRHVYKVQAQRLVDEGLDKVYYRLLARVPTLVLTQLKGVPVDQKEVQKFYDEYMAEIAKAEAAIEKLDVIEKYNQLTNKRFRVSSNQDVLKLCRLVLRKPVESADETELKKIKHKVIGLILKYRKASKNLSTYVLPLRTGSKHLFPDKLLHPLLSTTRTRTSRTSSEDPNSQNFPKRVNKRVRSQVKKAGWRVVSFDYGQIQARNVAMESKDPALVKAFWERYDIHTDWLDRIHKLYPQWIKGERTKEINKEYRNKAKNEFVFPSFFGAQPKSISGYLGIPEHIAKKAHGQFWQMFPNIKDWHERILHNYRKYGYVTGLSGVRRRAPISPNELINAPIQADEAMIVIDAMNRLSCTQLIELQPNLEIHDDLTFLWRADEIEKWAPKVIDMMVHTPFKWAHCVPIVVEMSVGTDWSNQKEIGVYASDTWKGDLGDTFYNEPMIGSWSDGDGWSNSRQDENHTKRRRHAEP